MKINSQPVYDRANRLLKNIYGKEACFREGQYEAIEATLTKRRTLVVQKTGWGKSLIYFICTKMLREQGRGCTIVVSPLLVLMQNQIEAAEKIGLRCDELNSNTKERHETILEEMENGTLDLVLATPESLYRENIQGALKGIRIGLFVIDEAHCISDWGHDFRLEYGKLRNVIKLLPQNVPVLATTATANNRVIQDLEKQLGDGVFISRGPLTRESLWIQVLKLESKAERYAWLLENLPKLPGSGIIYCLTKRDCDYLTDFLRRNKVKAMSYYSRNSDDEIINRIAEEKFRKNQIKAIVATVKLGMGYDKGDIAFVIHFQMPQNIVSYYQQIGRAGRNIDRAYVFLMSGKEDMDILNYFIDTAFPTEKEMKAIIKYLKEKGGARRRDIEGALNIRASRITKALEFLENDGYIFKDDLTYYLSPKPYKYDKKKYGKITMMRRNEVRQMQELISTKKCYSRFIAWSLDDSTAKDCGHCSNCLKRELLPETVNEDAKCAAEKYIGGRTITIEPRRMWRASESSRKIKYINMPGICISKYGDPGYGELVKKDKYSGKNRFCDELVGKSASLLKPIIRKEKIRYITCVPSLRSRIVEDFSVRLADNLGITFVRLLRKERAEPQKNMENGFHQCGNALSSFFVLDDVDLPERLVLVDDVVDSGWTLTVCGYRLMERGCEAVYPFALADSSEVN